MSRADDREAAAATAGGVIDGVAGVFALGAIIGGSGSDYARDLASSIARIFRGGGLEAALREDKARDKATLLALAVIADGAVTEAERPALADFAKRHGIDAGEVTAKVASLAEQLRDPAVFREKIARSASGLDEAERREVLAEVETLALSGSRAWPEPRGYRGETAPTPRALIATFREALGMK